MHFTHTAHVMNTFIVIKDSMIDEIGTYNEMIKIKVKTPQKRSLSAFAYSVFGSLFGYIVQNLG